MSGVTLTIPTIETERLRFRAPALADFEDEVAFYATDRSKGVGGPRDRVDTWRVLSGVTGHWALRGYGLWAIDDKATGRYCGRVGLWYPESWPEPEIGWTLMEHAEGRGLAYEAALATRRWAYETLGWTTAISLINADNTRSMRLAERMGCWLDGSFDHSTAGAIPVWRHPGPEAL